MTRLALALAGLAIVGPALASPCSDQIAALEERVRTQATGSMSASTSGQAAAGALEGQGTAGGTGAAAQAPKEKSAQAGEGGEKAMQAKVALDEARTADGKGDARACEDALARARQQLGTTP